MEFNWAGLSVCNCRHTGKWCGTLKAVGNTDHTRQTWIHIQTPLSPLAGCGPVGEGTSGKVLNWTVRSLNHAYTTTTRPPFNSFFTWFIFQDMYQAANDEQKRMFLLQSDRDICQWHERTKYTDQSGGWKQMTLGRQELIKYHAIGSIFDPVISCNEHWLLLFMSVCRL